RFDLNRPYIGKGNSQVLGLAASVPAKHMGVPEETRWRLPHDTPGQFGVGIRVVAQREQTLLAEETRAARDAERHHHAIAHFQFGNGGAEVHHFSHRFMTDDISFFHGRHEAVIKMQIRATNGRRGNSNNRVPRVLNLGIRDVFYAYIANAVPTEGFHNRLLYYSKRTMAKHFATYHV